MLKKLYPIILTAAFVAATSTTEAQVKVVTLNQKPALSTDAMRKLTPADASDSLSVKMVSLNRIPENKLIAPSFPGGDDSLMAYLERTIQYPEEAKKLGSHGIVKASFVIDTNGRVCDIRLRRDIEGECGAEVVRAMSIMPYWAPGRNADGTPRRTEALISIRFDLDNIVPEGVNLDPSKPEQDEGDFDF